MTFACQKSTLASDPTETAVVGSRGCFASYQKSDADQSTGRLAMLAPFHALGAPKIFTQFQPYQSCEQRYARIIILTHA